MLIKHAVDFATGAEMRKTQNVLVHLEHELFTMKPLRKRCNNCSSSILPELIKRTYAITMTQKSSQFQGSLRNVNFPMQNPRAKILTRDSKV